MKSPDRAAIADLLRDGMAVEDEFLPAPRVGELIRCAERRRDRGEFIAARIGAGHRLQRREDIRGDRTCWFAAPLFDAERMLLDDLERLRLDLNESATLGLFDLELHYAWYAPGAGYARHVDQPQGRGRRLVSLVLYLNQGWTPDAGGELRLFDGGAVRDIEPLAGRLVSFLTPGREHGVLTTHRERLSISGWFLQRE